MFIEWLRKIILFLSCLFLIATFSFVLMKSIPGDPFSEEQSLRTDFLAQLEKHHGFERPLWKQYKDYVLQLIRGDLGFSLKYPGKKVNEMIQEGFIVSASLGLQSFFIALIGGITLGSAAAYCPSSRKEKVLLFLTTMGLSIPSFILAALLQYWLAFTFSLFPVARWGTWSQTILPSLALALPPMAFLTKLIYSQMQEVLTTDYIKMARSKGLPFSSWFFKHALPNALLPCFSYLGQLFSTIIIGSFVVEKIFSIPGIGQWFVHSVHNRDYPFIMALTIFYSVILLSVMFFFDLLYTLVDPRIRLRKISC